MRPLSNLPMVAKVALPVVLLGSLAILVTLYSLYTLHTIDRDYRGLLDRDASATLLLSDARADLHEAGRLVYAVLTEQESATMLTAHATLRHLQAAFIAKVKQADPLLPLQTDRLGSLLEQQALWFQRGAEVINAAARWRGDQALAIIDGELSPLSRRLDTELELLRADAVTRYQADSRALHDQTEATLATTSIAVGLALLLFIGLSVHLSIRYISKPIQTLTRLTGKLRERHYLEAIPFTQQTDEIGRMATALQVFRDGMQRAELLEREARAAEQARELAERTAATKSAFLATISHEIRTPLNAIIVLLRLVLKEALPSSQRQRLVRAQTAARHLLGIINDILDFSKIDAGRMELETVAFRLQDVVDDTVDMLHEKARAKGLTLLIHDVSTLPPLLGDPLRISQLLLNYLNNAIKFSSEGSISVELQLHGTTNFPTLRGQVRDQGVGLAPEDIDRLFTPFQQVDASIARHHGGTGLGLAICQRLAELMNGRVGVVSQPGAGSCFWFEVQVQLACAAPQLPTESPAAQRELSREILHGLRILLVDDIALNREVGSDLLLQAGMQVDTAENGFDALNRLDQHADDHYSAVLMDIMMPGLDGLETTRMIRARPGLTHLPVIALSANATRDNITACFQAGMNGHVAKPIDEDALWETLLSALEDGCGERDRSMHLAARQAADYASGGPSTAPMPGTTDTLDTRVLERLRSRVSDDRFQAMLVLLIQDCRAQIDGIRQCADKQDMAGLAHHAHDLCSTAGHAGMSDAAALCQSLHDSAKAGEKSRAASLAEQLSQMLAKGIAQMENYRNATRTPPCHD